jgi:hypothetical protein
MVLPVFMAFYLYLKGDVPSSYSPFLDDYVQKTVLLAESRAGRIAILFLLATLIIDNYDGPWNYENAVDITFGVYSMALGLITWWEMREEPEPELEPEPKPHSKTEGQP